MVRSELVARLASHYRHLTVCDVAASVSAILTAIAENLATDGGRAEIRGFGTFSVSRRPSRLGHNPATLAPVFVPAKYMLHFKPGAELRTRVAAAAKGEMPATGKSKNNRTDAELTLLACQRIKRQEEHAAKADGS
jgi:integration host factor subunit beta